MYSSSGVHATALETGLVYYMIYLYTTILWCIANNIQCHMNKINTQFIGMERHSCDVLGIEVLLPCHLVYA